MLKAGHDEKNITILQMESGSAILNYTEACGQRKCMPVYTEFCIFFNDNFFQNILKIYFIEV